MCLVFNENGIYIYMFRLWKLLFCKKWLQNSRVYSIFAYAFV